RARSSCSSIGILLLRSNPTVLLVILLASMPYARRRIELPAMTPGTGRGIVYHRFGRAGARPKAYLQAAIHANELPGAMALHHLMPMLMAAERRRLIRGEIVVVPTV